MKKIKICHLYYDLMDLYGETGNIKAITAFLDNQKQDYEVLYKTIDDKINFKDFEIIYIGCGDKEAQKLALKDIMKYKDDIKEIIEDTTIIATGNSFELFGTNIDRSKALGIFDFKSTSVDEQIKGEQILSTTLIDKKIVGFQNRLSVNNIKEDFLFEVISGNGNNIDETHEGYHKYNFYGTYTFGPLLIRNPYLLEYIMKNLFDKLGIAYREVKETPDIIAYNEFIKNFNIE